MARPINLALYEEQADISALAASYGYGLAKSPLFVDGNKRAAFMALGLFLGINGFRLTATPAEAIEVILALASGQLSEEELASWIRKNLSS